MDIKIDIWSFLLALSLFQGLFVVPFLFKKIKGKWLGFLMLIITLTVTHHLLLNLHFYKIWPHFLNITIPLIYLIGPFYYFHIRNLLQDDFRLKSADLRHFILVLLAYIYHSKFYLLSGSHKIAAIDYAMEHELFKVSFVFIIPIVIHQFQIMFYLYESNKLLNLVNISTNQQNIKYQNWLKRFTFSFAIYWFGVFIWMLYLLLGNGFYSEVDYVFILFTGSFIHVLAFTAIYHNREFSQHLLNIITSKYEKSSLSDEHANGILKKLLNHMERNKPYLNPSLKISDLSNDLSISTNIISQVLNQNLKKNFFEFVNEYRLSEAMRRLSDPKYAHIKILSIAIDSGFSNKNTFNRIFKLHTGLTPSQFIRKTA